MRLVKHIMEGSVHHNQICSFELPAQLLCREEKGKRTRAKAGKPTGRRLFSKQERKVTWPGWL